MATMVTKSEKKINHWLRKNRSEENSVLYII